MKDYKGLFKNKKFIFLLNSQVLSQITIQIMNFTLLIKLFSDTNSPLATSFLWVFYALPVVFFGPIASTSVDILNRRKILIFSNLFQSLTILVFALYSQTSIFLIYGIVMVYSFFNQFYVPAELATLPSLVKKKFLPQANGLFFITQQASIIVGFSVAGILNSFIGFTNTLFLGSFLLFLAFVNVIFLPDMKVKKSVSGKYEKDLIGFFRRLFDGYLFIKNNRLVLAPLALLVILNISLAVIVVNMPVIAKEILSINLELAGILMVIPSAVGAGIAAVYIPKKLKLGTRKFSIIQSSIIVLTVSLASFSLLIPQFLGGMRTLVSFLVLVATGYSFVGIFIPTQTLLQEVTPQEFRGRVFGNFWFMMTIATIFPVIFSGTISEIFGAKFLIFMLFLAYLGLVILVHKKGKEFVKNGFKINNEK